MALNIFSLVGSIMVDSTEANNSIKKTSDNAKSLKDTLAGGLKKVGSAAAGIAKTVAGVAAGVAGAATAAGAAVYSLANDTAAVGDNIDKMSQKIGITREAYQELDFICSQSGTSVDNLRAGMKTLTSVMDTTRAGTSSTATALEELGIAVVNSDGSYRDNEEVMWESFEALTKLEDQTEKERLAVELFGKAGTELLPMLNGSADSIQSMREQAHELGLVMSDDAVDAAVKYSDTMDQLKRSMSAVKNNIGASMLPMIQKFAAKLLDYMPKVQQFAERLIPLIEELAESILDPLMQIIDEVLPPLMSLVSSLISPLSEMIQQMLPPLISFIGRLVPLGAKIVEKLLPPLVSLFGKLTPLFDLMLELLEPILGLAEKLIDPIAKILDALSPVFDLIAELAQNLLGKFGDGIGAAADGLSTILGPALDTVATMCGEVLMPALEGIIAFFNGDFDGGWQGLGEAFVGVFESIFSTIDDIFGTHLSEWYDEVQAFWGKVGGKLYEMTHGDELEMAELDNKYTDLSYDFGMALNDNLRSGMTAEKALEAAKNKLLTNSEMLYYFDNRLADIYDLAEAEERALNLKRAESAETGAKSTAGAWYADYYRNKETPHLARGGIAYGQTAAVIGDNADAAVNPEVVAPLSELKSILAGAFADIGNDIAAAIKSAVGERPQAMEITVRLSDDTELTRAIIRNINDCTRQDGVCVIKGV